MTTDTPSGSPNDDLDPVESQLRDELDDVEDDFVDQASEGDYKDEYEDEYEDGEGYEDDGGEYVDEEYDEGQYDDEFDDDEFDDEEYDDEDESRPRKKKKRRRVRLFCFNCNRPEGFFTAYKGRWFYSYFLGLTFGFGNFFGPFKCQCCGANRFLKADWVHPRMWIKKPSVTKS